VGFLAQQIGSSRANKAKNATAPTMTATSTAAIDLHRPTPASRICLAATKNITPGGTKTSPSEISVTNASPKSRAPAATRSDGRFPKGSRV
jgi:hypothetical protein